MKRIISAVIILLVLFFLQDYFRYSSFSGITNVAFAGSIVYLIVAIITTKRNQAVPAGKEKITLQKTPGGNRGGLWLFAIIAVLLLVIFNREMLGRNSFKAFVFTDSLLKVTDAVPPFIAWGFLGLLVGAMYGSIVAWKKYKLPFAINLIPVGAFIICMVVLYLVNHPLDAAPVAAMRNIPSGYAYNLVNAADNNAQADKNAPYKTAYLLDNNDVTAWVTDLAKAGKDQDIFFIFKEVDGEANKNIQCTGFRIKNGNRKSAQAWADFARLKDISIRNNETFIGYATATDSDSGYQEVRINPVKINLHDTISIKIYSVYPGRKYVRRVAITELVPIVQYE